MSARDTVGRFAPSIPSIPEHVSEIELATIVTNRERLERLENEVKVLKKELEKSEDTVIQKLLRKIPVIGGFAAKVEVETGRRSPKWKDVALILATKIGLDSTKFEKDTIEATEPSKKNVLVVIQKLQ